MRAVCLQHVSFEGPGALATSLAKHGAQIECHLVPKDGLPPDPGDLLIVMGGPMSANDPDPWIAEETAFIQAAIQSGLPVLGICLGSQLMAKALGAQVRPGRAIEIGITPIRLSQAGKQDPVFSTLPPSFDVFEWHGEIFDLPKGSLPLAASDLAPLQAFRFGSRAYGLLFHLELEQTGIEALCRECAPDLARAKQTAQHVIDHAVPYLSTLHRMADRLLTHLLAPQR